ncbi:MAG: c-type cytochrome [Pseudomonadota bacterium]|nr:c-type cytochrome [Pseudomonadota bacterium]
MSWAAAVLLAAPGCRYTLAPPVSMSPPVEARVPNAAAVWVPPGYAATVVAGGLNFPSGITVDADGKVFVVEAGYSYGDVWLEPRLLQVLQDGTYEVVATGEDAPWTGVDAGFGDLFVAEGGLVDGGSILRITTAGKVTPLVSGLPGMGDHHTNGPVVAPDGWVYFGQGTATNSGYVGLDSYEYGWLSRRPQYHDIPCADVQVTGRNHTTRDPLTEDPTDRVETGAFAPFGTPNAVGETIPGRVPCTGAVMRVRPDGGPVELVAWGFRNPFGLAFTDAGQLYVTDNGYDERGSRKVWGTGDWLWAVTPGAWYGWPDYAGGVRLDSPPYRRPLRKRVRDVLAEAPGTPPDPVATFGVHASADGLDVAPEEFGAGGEVFVAEFGDMAPAVGKVLAPVGRRVVRVDVGTGVLTPFAVTDADAAPGAGLERPVDVAFSPDGQSLYVLDFGVMGMRGKQALPQPGTGVVWRIDRVGAGPESATVEPQDETEALGQRVYAAQCHSCHPDGHAGLGPSVLVPPRCLVPIQVRLGLGAMPAFRRSTISREELRALRAWVTRMDTVEPREKKEKE